MRLIKRHRMECLLFFSVTLTMTGFVTPQPVYTHDLSAVFCELELEGPLAKTPTSSHGRFRVFDRGIEGGAETGQ